MSRSTLDLAGQKFGMLTVLQSAGRNSSRSVVWLCSCECGGQKFVPAPSLRNGSTRSCGCLVAKGNARTHGQTGTSEYGIWSGAKNRCFNRKGKHYASYGGRGITMCDAWANSFEAFLADMGPKPEGHSLDRIDNDGPYSPENCRWADRKTQNGNKRHVDQLQLRIALLEEELRKCREQK